MLHREDLSRKGAKPQRKAFRTRQRFVPLREKSSRKKYTSCKAALTSRMFSIASYRSRRVFAVLAAVVLIVAGGLVLRAYFRNSDIARGVLALNEAYKQQRPGEARITSLAYAPPPATRGVAPDKFDAVARDHAERLLQDAAHEQKSAAAFHALGQLYL